MKSYRQHPQRRTTDVLKRTIEEFVREVSGRPGEIAKATQEGVVFETALDGGSNYCC